MARHGYYLIARGFLKHPRFAPREVFSSAEAMLWLIESAAFAPRDVPIMVGTQRQTVHLEPGQMTHSIRFLASVWRWSPNRVQRFLRDLADDGSVATQTDTAQTIITLCNWDKYQNPFSATDTQTDTQSDTQTDTKKKELKEFKKDTAFKGASSPKGFEEWFANYPRSIEKPAAERNYKKLMKSGAISFDALMAATARYAAKVAAEKPETQFIKKPANWLRDGGYDDQPASTPGLAIVDPATFDTDKWRRNLKIFSDRGEWSELWGPKPGAPGCLVPPHLIVTPVSASKGAA
jgi:DNA-binding transcriptional regulator YhcF (GntR family)